MGARGTLWKRTNRLKWLQRRWSSEEPGESEAKAEGRPQFPLCEGKEQRRGKAEREDGEAEGKKGIRETRESKGRRKRRSSLATAEGVMAGGGGISIRV